MRTMEEIRRSNERTLAAFDGAIAERQDLLRQYQQLNQDSLELSIVNSIHPIRSVEPLTANLEMSPTRVVEGLCQQLRAQ